MLDLAHDLKDGALDLIHSSWTSGKPIRLITLTAINLVDQEPDMQLSFFDNLGNNDNTAERNESIEKAMDQIREKFGSNSIAFGQIIDNDLGIDI